LCIEIELIQAVEQALARRDRAGQKVTPSAIAFARLMPHAIGASASFWAPNGIKRQAVSARE
jgi:hypothetical protein